MNFFERALTNVRNNHLILLGTGYSINKFDDFLTSIEEYKNTVESAQPGQHEMYELTRTIPEFKDIYKAITETNRFDIDQDKLDALNDLYNSIISLYLQKSIDHITRTIGQNAGKRKRTRKLNLRKKKKTRRA
jgi:hypothetical protein